MKKFVFVFVFLGILLLNPLFTKASTFTNLKSEFFDLTERINNFGTNILAQTISSDNSDNSDNSQTNSKISNVTLTVDKKTIKKGDSVMLTWSSKGMKICRPKNYPIDPNLNWENSYDNNFYFLNGSKKVDNIRKTTTFYVDCTRHGFDKVTDTASVVVEVKEEKVKPVIYMLANFPIFYGGNLVLSWETENATSCIASSHPSIWSGNKGLKGTEVIKNLKSSAILTLTCSGPNGSSKSTFGVKVQKRQIPLEIGVTQNNEENKLSVYWNINNSFGDISKISCNASSSPSYLWNGEKGINGKETFYNLEKNISLKLICSGDGWEPTTWSDDFVFDNNLFSKVESSTPILTPSIENNQICKYTFTRSLVYGSKDRQSNKEVELLQSILVDEGFLKKEDVDGKFYNKTLTALKLLQKKYELSQTGNVDVKTKTKLNELYMKYCPN